MVPDGVYLVVGKKMTKKQKIELATPHVIICQFNSLMYLQGMTGVVICFVFYMSDCAI